MLQVSEQKTPDGRRVDFCVTFGEIFVFFNICRLVQDSFAWFKYQMTTYDISLVRWLYISSLFVKLATYIIHIKE